MRATRVWTAVLAAGVLATAAMAHGVASAAAGGATSCKSGNLTVSMTHIKGSNGAGQTGYRLSIHNRGGTRSLGNHPGLTLLAASGKALPTHVRRQGGTRPIAIGSGATASARLRFSPDVPGVGEPARRPCEPVAHKVRVSLTAPAHGAVTGPIKPPTSVCERGSIQELGL